MAFRSVEVRQEQLLYLLHTCYAVDAIQMRVEARVNLDSMQ